MAKPYNDKKFQLGEPLASKLKDFCAANYNCAAVDVIRDALNEHIDRRLQSHDMRRRFIDARNERLSKGDNVVSLSEDKD
ncbi:MAG: hypothetical protein RIM72_11965 [Alphaproteobacteria bacterium]